MTAYTTGTITLAQGSKSIIGTDTGWQTAIIAAGVIYVQAEGGSALPFNTVVSDTEITAEIEWTGASGTYEYALVRETTYGTQQIATATALSQHVQRLANAAIAAIAGVTPQADKLLLFTGASTATLISRNDFMQGVDYDETVADVAGLAIYDGEDTGFSVLVIDAGGGRAAIYIKKSATVGDWYDPAFITPEKGDQGDPGNYTTITFEPVETLLPGADVTMTITNTGPGAISLRFGIPVGVPGDMEGPNGATDGAFAAFDGPSGKKLKQKIITALLTTFDNSVAGLKDNPTTVQAAINTLATSPAGGANDALFALEIADLKGVRQGMVGGVADAFDDETGVDIGNPNAGIDANTLLCLHMDGANAGVIFPDASSFTRTVTPTNVTTSTAQSKFGGSSALFAGTGSLSIPDSNDWAFGTTFTIDAWIRATDLSTGRSIVTQSSDGNNMIRLLVLASGAVFYEVWSGASTLVTLQSAAGTIVANTWAHIALVRNGTSWVIYKDGVSVATVTSSATVPNIPGPILVGNVSAGTAYPMIGNIDELRISNIARWTAAFTPPSVAYYQPQSASSGQQYNAAGDYYSPVKPDAVATVVNGTIDSSAVFTIFVRTFFLVNGAKVKSVGVHSSLARSYTVKIGRRVSAGVYDILTEYTFNHPGGGWFDHVLSEPYVLPSTGSLVLGVVQPLMNGASASPTVLRAWKTGDVTGAGQTGFNEDTATVSPSVRLDYFVTASMSLVSVAYPAAAQPSSGRMAVQVSGSEAINPNSDLFADMSRDGGATWSTGDLSLTVSFSGVRMFEVADIDLSSQPSGSNMSWRVRTANDKNIQVSGVVAQWKD